MSDNRAPSRDERGAAAVEYAVVTVAAASLGGVLLSVTLGPNVDWTLMRWFHALLVWILQQIGIS